MKKKHRKGFTYVINLGGWRGDPQMGAGRSDSLPYPLFFFFFFRIAIFGNFGIFEPVPPLSKENHPKRKKNGFAIMEV